MKFRRTNKVGKFEVKKVKNKGAVSKNVSTLPLIRVLLLVIRKRQHGADRVSCSSFQSLPYVSQVLAIRKSWRPDIARKKQAILQDGH